MSNKFCIAPNSISKKTLFKLKSELGENFPIIKSNVLDSKCQGRLIACNSKGILLPSGTSSSEFNYIKNCVPENIVVRYCDENLTALGNSLVSNDYSGLTGSDFSKINKKK